MTAQQVCRQLWPGVSFADCTVPAWFTFPNELTPEVVAAHHTVDYMRASRILAPAHEAPAQDGAGSIPWGRIDSLRPFAARIRRRVRWWWS